MMVKYGQMIPGITQSSTHTEWGVQPTALKELTIAVPKFGQVVNCQCNDVDQGIVGCTPMGNPYISPIYIYIYSGYLWVIIPKNP